MKIYLVRHATAHDRDPKRWPDDAARPLTRRGAQRFAREAKVIRKLAPRVSRLLTSPLVRARQTAHILFEVARWPQPETLPELSPDAAPQELLHALHLLTPPEECALVGHEPSLSRLAAFMLGGPQGRVILELKKGGIACLETTQGLRPRAFQLLWLATPKLIRA